MIDTKQRPVWRVRGHDVEEFEEIVARHGVWKRDLEKFVEAIAKRKKSPLFAGTEAAQTNLASDPKFLASVDRFASSVRTGEINSITISTPGLDPVVIDKQAAENIHKKATRGRGASTN